MSVFQTLLSARTVEGEPRRAPTISSPSLHSKASPLPCATLVYFVRYFLRRFVPPSSRMLLVESGSRQITQIVIPHLRAQFGDVFINYFLRLKQSELGRFNAWKAENGDTGDEPTAWEQNEYFDFF